MPCLVLDVKKAILLWSTLVAGILGKVQERVKLLGTLLLL